MTKEEKYQFVDELTERFRNNPNFYIVNMGSMSVEETFNFRKKCHESNIKLMMAKNKLIIKALSRIDENKYKELLPAFKEASSIIFVSDDTKAPAKLLKDLRKGKKELPALKAAFIQETAFLGESQLDTLVSLKSKQDLLGEIVGLLQSPMSNVIGAIKSGGQTIAGLVKTLSEREGS